MVQPSPTPRSSLPAPSRLARPSRLSSRPSAAAETRLSDTASASAAITPEPASSSPFSDRLLAAKGTPTRTRELAPRKTIVTPTRTSLARSGTATRATRASLATPGTKSRLATPARGTAPSSAAQTGATPTRTLATPTRTLGSTPSRTLATPNRALGATPNRQNTVTGTRTGPAAAASSRLTGSAARKAGTAPTRNTTSKPDGRVTTPTRSVGSANSASAKETAPSTSSSISSSTSSTSTPVSSSSRVSAASAPAASSASRTPRPDGRPSLERRGLKTTPRPDGRPSLERRNLASGASRLTRPDGRPSLERRTALGTGITARKTHSRDTTSTASDSRKVARTPSKNAPTAPENKSSEDGSEDGNDAASTGRMEATPILDTKMGTSSRLGDRGADGKALPASSSSGVRPRRATGGAIIRPSLRASPYTRRASGGGSGDNVSRRLNLGTTGTKGAMDIDVAAARALTARRATPASRRGSRVEAMNAIAGRSGSDRIDAPDVVVPRLRKSNGGNIVESFRASRRASLETAEATAVLVANELEAADDSESEKAQEDAALRYLTETRAAPLKSPPPPSTSTEMRDRPDPAGDLGAMVPSTDILSSANRTIGTPSRRVSGRFSDADLCLTSVERLRDSIGKRRSRSGMDIHDIETPTLCRSRTYNNGIGTRRRFSLEPSEIDEEDQQSQLARTPLRNIENGHHSRASALGSEVGGSKSAQKQRMSLSASLRDFRLDDDSLAWADEEAEDITR